MRIVEEEGEEVISEQLIRSIWEVVQPPLKILLEVIIAPLRDLLHSYNFNHHQTNYPQNHSDQNQPLLYFFVSSSHVSGKFAV